MKVDIRIININIIKINQIFKLIFMLKANVSIMETIILKYQRKFSLQKIKLLFKIAFTYQMHSPNYICFQSLFLLKMRLLFLKILFAF